MLLPASMHVFSSMSTSHQSCSITSLTHYVRLLVVCVVLYSYAVSAQSSNLTNVLLTANCDRFTPSLCTM